MHPSRTGRRLPRLLVTAVVAVALAGCGGSDEENAPTADPRMAGGDTTIFTTTSNAFSTPAPNLSPDELELHMDGDAAFDVSFVTAPAVIHGGLGPVFNEKSCVACHPRDGRGKPPADGEVLGAMLLKASVGNDEVTGPVPVPGFGTQLQHRAVFGHEAEVRIVVHHEYENVDLADGSSVELRRPRFDVESAYTEVPQGRLLSPRVGPPVFGRGLLEAVTDRTILEYADERDRDRDGISGRPNFVLDAIDGKLRIGRFGLKAGNPTLRQQVAGAYNEDMGVTTSVFPVESCEDQPQDDGLGDDPELGDDELASTVFYVQTLAVPARRDLDDAEALRGEELFSEAGCASCHRPLMFTAAADELPPLAGQAIWPYSDLLLHDMGEGLADGRGEFVADGREWKTPPLWGIGLTHVVNGESAFLHDGRARTLLEAVLWHGGEAAAARDRVAAMATADREALLRFLGSL